VVYVVEPLSEVLVVYVPEPPANATEVAVRPKNVNASIGRIKMVSSNQCRQFSPVTGSGRDVF